MPEATIENESTNPRSWLLFRSNDAVQSFPVEYRWEFTRRHPYYQQYWQAAAQYHNSPTSDPSERLMQEIAVRILTAVNVSDSMVPPDPRLEAEALGICDLGGVWESGAVAPAMFRTLASMLLLALPAAQRLQFGRLLTESAEYNSQDLQQMSGILLRLAEMREPEWDSFPNAPVISINLQMPQRAISVAIERLVRRWKEERGIVERRRRDDKLDEYLAVWDRREGWTDGAYDASEEKTFQAIAQEIGDPIQTVIGRYRLAFRHLSGHDYIPELWIRLMGPLKLSRFALGDSAGGGLTLRRPWRSPNLRPVTESVLLPGRNEFEQPDFLAAANVTQSEIELVEFSLDVETLIGRGRTDDEIIDELEPPFSNARDLIGEMRRRHESR